MPTHNPTDRKRVSRRRLIGGATAAAAAVVTRAEARPEPRFPSDVAILNVALGLELEAIAAYDAGARSNLLNPDQLKIAASFQQDHERHRDGLIAWIRRLGGTPVEARGSYEFGAIRSAADIVKLAQRLEEGAEIAYLTNAGNLANKEVLNAAVPIMADEVRHNIVFRQLLKMDVFARLKY